MSDEIGKRYGKLVVEKCLDREYKGITTLWLCKCDCGNEVSATTEDLHSGRKKSCATLGYPKKEVSRYTLYDELIDSFPSMSEASRLTGVAVTQISRCCKGKIESAGKYKWRLK